MLPLATMSSNSLMGDTLELSTKAILFLTYHHHGVYGVVISMLEMRYGSMMALEKNAEMQQAWKKMTDAQIHCGFGKSGMSLIHKTSIPPTWTSKFQVVVIILSQVELF